MRRVFSCLVVVTGALWAAAVPGVWGEPSRHSAGKAIPFAADFNGDGFSDLAAGAPFQSVGGRDYAGAVNVRYGSSAGIQADAPDDQLWTQDVEGVEDRAERGDLFGQALAAGNFNGDGFADLAIGVPRENVELEDGSGTMCDAGAVSVLYGSPLGLQVDAPADQFWSQESPGITGLAECPDQFGWSLAAGDFDGDGFGDLAAGVPVEDAGAESIPRAGAINMIYGSADGL